MSGLILLIIVVVGLTLLITKARRHQDGYHVPGAAPFVPTHADRNIAIDIHTGQIWIRDDRGKVWIFQKSELRAWKHQYREWRNHAFTFREDNMIELSMFNVDHPTHRVPFDRHSDKFGNQRNFKAASEWTDRLTAFVNGNGGCSIPQSPV